LAHDAHRPQPGVRCQRAAHHRLVQALTQARAPAHRPWWRQLQAGVHAFGGLIGVALIVAAAVVLLLLADRWLVDRPPHDDEQTRR